MKTFLAPENMTHAPIHRQKGAVLAIALILLVVVTLLGLSSVKTVSQQEKMVSHSNDRSLAYQFAEAALREGEAQARVQALNLNAAFPAAQYIADGNACPNNDPSINNCANGLCTTPDPDCAPRWTNATFNGWTNYNTVAAVMSASGNTLSGTPQYFIEILRPTDITCVPGAQTFDMACNQRYPDPDIADPCAATFPPTSGFQWCNFYRYRVTARVAIRDRAAVVLQSILSVQPN
ncbi:PilX N-terminal domain-containing pilus assembly protein [uncultured Dechloromonas sp.]|uniref:pilus assembly PilX family protein n=1 Tax=uncultured Dechloromonas sp. TaxID=171719 RepID=UPI0025E0A836|nr:PilX N-terminal domain-containing pilus assembly protein [uncultured Dechloromonas sp.]